MEDFKNIIEKWIEFYQTKNKFLLNLKKKCKSIDDDFFEDLQIKENYLFLEIGLGYSKLNELSSFFIADRFKKYIKNNNENKNIDVFISQDSKKTKLFVEKISLILGDENINVNCISDYEPCDKKTSIRILNKSKIEYMIYIETDIFNPGFFKVVFFENQNEIKNAEIIKNIFKYNNYLDIFNIKKNKSNEINFLSLEKIVDDYVDTLMKIWIRKNDQKKLKVFLSIKNRSSNLIIKKTLKKMGFPYKENKNFSNYFFKIKKINNPTSLFRKQIFEAKRNNSDFLICSFDDSSQLFCFIINRNGAKFIDISTFTTYFIDGLARQLKRQGHPINKAFISSNISKNESIDRLIEKHNLDFVLSDNPKLIDGSNFLFYWNSNYQFCFGEDNNITYNFYHIIVKLFELTNYYKTQNSNIYSEIVKNNNFFNSYNVFSYYISKTKIYDIFQIKEILSNNKKKGYFLSFETIEENILLIKLKNNIKIDFFVDKNNNKYKLIFQIMNNKKNKSLLSNLFILNFINKKVVKKINKLIANHKEN